MEFESDCLLCAPSAASEEFAKPFKRKTCRYENKSQRFLVADRKYSNQYSHIYFCRLAKMKKRVMRAAERAWGEWCGEWCGEWRV